MALKLTPAIDGYFDFSHYIDDEPSMGELKVEQQRELVAAYLRDYPSDVFDLFEYLPDHENSTVAGMIDGTVDPDMRKEFDDALGDAAIAAFKTAIDQRITEMHERFIADHGVFDADSDHEPGGLRGFRDVA